LLQKTQFFDPSNGQLAAELEIEPLTGNAYFYVVNQKDVANGKQGLCGACDLSSSSSGGMYGASVSAYQLDTIIKLKLSHSDILVPSKLRQHVSLRQHL